MLERRHTRWLRPRFGRRFHFALPAWYHSNQSLVGKDPVLCMEINPSGLKVSYLSRDRYKKPRERMEKRCEINKLILLTVKSRLTRDNTVPSHLMYRMESQREHFIWWKVYRLTLMSVRE